MNELRWILLAAGVVLIAGLYLWGVRSRGAGRGEGDGSRRPAVFSGSARGFEDEPAEVATEAEDDDAFVVRAESRRIEPRIEPRMGDDTLDADLDTEDATPVARRPSILDDEEEMERPAVSRREPTFSASRAEPAPAPSRFEPTLQPEPVTSRGVEPKVTPPPPQAPEPPKRPSQKILAIRVTATAPARFDGAELLEALRSEGLSFGRYEIFHHLHEDGRPIFSVASLKEPGTFDLAAMPDTPYPGVALFAVLPGPVSAAEAFDEMIFSARALATHLNGALADERGAPLTALRVGKLREDALEFERSFGSA
jgi:cell division protein ZipA